MFRNWQTKPTKTHEERLQKDFSQAYAEYGSGIIRYMLSSGMQTADAQDILQSSFLAMWELRDRIENTANLAPLWFTIARHKMFDLFRKRRLSIPLPSEMERIPDPHNGFRELDLTRLRRRIADELNRLPKEMSEAFRLTKISGLSIREAAGIMGISESDLKSKVFRARKKLMRELTDLEDFLKN